VINIEHMAARNERKLRALEALADNRWHRMPDWAEAAGLSSPCPGPAYRKTRRAYTYALKLERMYLIERGRVTASLRHFGRRTRQPLMWILIN
jgi:hypothetical protein